MIKIADKKELVKYVWSFTLGDGCLFRRNDNPGRNAIYILNQIQEHRDYVEWQASILENLTSIKYYEQDAFIDKRGVNNRPQIRITSKAHPFYTTLYERIYLNRIKTISPHDLKLLDWESLAILFMDDGYIQTQETQKLGRRTRAFLCTENYTYGDLVLLQKAIYEKTNLPFNFKKRKLKDGYGHRLVLSPKFFDEFIKGVESYIFPSFQYKLDRTIDSAIVDDEIVLSDM
jgi:hypothetical protein